MKKIIDLTNKEYNNIKVIERDYKKENERKDKKTYWKCKCYCGNIFSVSGNNLKSGNTKSCGCYKNEINKKQKNTKNIKWEESENEIIGITNKNIKFLIDKEDFEKVKNFCWRQNIQGYIVANSKDNSNKTIFIHRIILNAKDDEIIDHINQDKTNNKKLNLRFATKSQNNTNIKHKKNNTTGYTGITINNNGNYLARISINNKRIYLGTFKTFKEAVISRHNAEINIHKDWSGEINRKKFKYIIKNIKDTTDSSNMEEAQDIIE